MANLFIPSYLLPLIFFFTFHLSSSYSNKLPPTYAATQLKFWSQNVKNQMPSSIQTKLSPLTTLAYTHYTQQNLINADAKFCSLAKLACSTSLQTKYSPLGININYNGQSTPSLAKTHPNTLTSPLGININYNGQSKSPQETNSNPLIPKLGININYNGQRTSLENIDPNSFFRSSSLKEGHTVTLPNLKRLLPHRSFLPPLIASKLSLTPKGITTFFPQSPKATVEAMLSYCSSAAEEGELKSCPRSLEEMIAFSKATLGATELVSLTSKSTAGSGKAAVIGAVKRFKGEKFVACHEILLPFAAYYCHTLTSSRIYAVDLVAPGTRAQVNTAVAICHMDTSKWSPEHVAFEVLKSGPGKVEACHWMNEIDLAWTSADV